MTLFKKTLAGLFALCIGTVSVPASVSLTDGGITASAAENLSSSMEWGTMRIGGGGFVSGIVTGKKAMYARTDVGGAYKYNYETESWDQLLGFLNEADRGLLSVDAMAIDPTDDNTVYFLCGCAYFSDAKTVIFKTTDGGKTFERTDVTDLIQVHANGNGRQTGESIAIDPSNPDVIYCGGDVTAGSSCLIKSTDGGKTWNPVKGYDDLGLFKTEIKWPLWTSHMVRALDDGEYQAQNGISTIYIYDGKVYVGTSTTGKNSVVVADVKDDKFTDLSGVLDSSNFPARITGDGQGNIYFTYQGTVIVGQGGAAGGIYKYDPKTGKAEDISPLKHLYNKSSGEQEAAGEGGYSGISIDMNNPNHMVSSTCGLWYSQMWQEWTEEQGPAWGDRFFRSEDGGKTWRETTPGTQPGWGQPLIADYLADGGYDWIRNKAIHWVGAYVIDPVNPDRTVSTSGNGVFMCDNTWDAKPQFYFHPDGIEEVVALDMISTPGGPAYSAIGDYDGFIHENQKDIPMQYQPNMGSTSAIAYCPSNIKVLARVQENNAEGYYSLDGGKTWENLNVPSSGGKMAITQLDDGSYRFFKSDKSNAAVKYSDDFGKTWSDCSGLKGSKTSYMLVDPNDASKVYAYTYTYNEYWSSNPNLTEPSLEEAHYSVFTSTDYGKTFTENQLCRYDMCDHAGDLAYIKEDTIAAAAGWYGLYIITENGSKAEKTDVFYAKTAGYGAPEKEGGPNTLFIYGKPSENDPEGIYRSTDEGKTWVCINDDHLYGGTGNGNFLVGDMNEFGKVYMSTVGCGIVVGRIASEQPDIPDDKILWGDANCDTIIDIADAVLIMQSIANPDAYGVKGTDPTHITEQGSLNADVYENGTSGITAEDALQIQKFRLKLITSLDPKDAK